MIRLSIAFCVISFCISGILTIWNGKEVKENIPYQVAIVRSNNIVAGGSVIGEILVLTAARPVNRSDPYYLKVIVGTNILVSDTSKLEKKKKDVQVIKIHEKYKSGSKAFNVAILLLKEPIYQDKACLTIINRVKLAKSGLEIKPGTKLTVRGWGKNEENGKFGKLRSGTIIVKDNKKCKEIYELRRAKYNMDTQFCSSEHYRENVCDGDVGNPVINEDGEQVGIVSLDTACGQLLPGFFIRITEPSIHKWIQDFKNIEQNLLAC